MIKNLAVRIVGVLVSLILILTLIVGSYLYYNKNTLLEKLFDDKICELKELCNVDVSYESLELHGTSTFVLKNLILSQPSDSSLLNVEKASIRLDLLSAIRGDLYVDSLQIDNIKVCLIDSLGYSNFKELSCGCKEQNESVSEENSTPKKNALERILGIMPNKFCFSNIYVQYIKNDHKFCARIPELGVSDCYFNSIVDVIYDDIDTCRYSFNGLYDKNEEKVETRICSYGDSCMHVPYLDKMYEAKVRLDSLFFSVSIKKSSRTDNIRLTGMLNVDNLNVDYYRLSNKNIKIGDFKLNYDFKIKKDEFELDSSSTVSFNNIQFNPYLRLQTDTTLSVLLAINKTDFESTDLFSSIPHGLFSNLDSLQTTGHLDYHLYFSYDTAHVDSIKFVSALDKHDDFKIVKFGHTDFRLLNKEFVYNAYDDGKLIRTYTVGPSWEQFCPIDDVSKYLVHAIRYAEDPLFFSHKGFYQDAIKDAIIKNIKEKRFARGGSTISMQLVKNIFLNQNKNLARKVEEIIIVWLIENERLSSKNRMFEIYLNIAEWGPNVYGVREASMFYFLKKPSDLTPCESIFLASIIPSPKKFMYKFGNDNKLRPGLKYYYMRISSKLMGYGIISAEEYESMSLDCVQLVGNAKNFLHKSTESTQSEDTDDNSGYSIIDLEDD